MAVKTFDIKRYPCIYGNHIVSGFATDNAISVEYKSDAWTLQVGADGEAARSKSNDYSATITLELMQTSLSNNALSTFYQADQLGNAGALPFLLKDLNGNTVLSAETAWIVKMTNVTISREVQSRIWTLETNALISFVAGNQGQ